MTEDNIRETATEAPIAFKAIRPQLLQRSSKHGKIKEIAEPLRGSGCDKRLIVALGAEYINDTMTIIKRSKEDAETITSLRRMSKEAFFDASAIYPPPWESWRRMLTKFQLYEITSFAGWLKIVHHLRPIHILHPVDLAALSFREASALGGEHNFTVNAPFYGEPHSVGGKKTPLVPVDSIGFVRRRPMRLSIKLGRVRPMTLRNSANGESSGANYSFQRTSTPNIPH